MGLYETPDTYMHWNIVVNSSYIKAKKQQLEQ